MVEAVQPVEGTETPNHAPPARAATARMSTERTTRLRERMLAAREEISVARARIFSEAFAAHPEEPLIVRRALAYQAVLRDVPIAIHDDELLVGGITEMRKGAILLPETRHTHMKPRHPRLARRKQGVQKLLEASGSVAGRFSKTLAPKLPLLPLLIELELESFDSRQNQRFFIDPAAKRELEEEILPQWEGRSAFERYESYLTREQKKLQKSFVYTTENQFVGGLFLFCPDYRRLVEEGLLGIAARAEAEFARLQGDTEGDGRKRDLFRAMAISSRAVIAFANRYADLAEEQAKGESSAARREELLEIARICRRVPAHPARTLREGLQSLWFAYLGLVFDDGGMEIPFGRMDQVLGGLYQEDLRLRRIRREEALELLEAFFVKASEVQFLLDNGAALLEDGNSGRLTVTIGGIDEDGDDATNELSYLFLDAIDNARLIQPDPAVRLHPGAPEVFVRRVVEIMTSGANNLAVFNDDVIVQGFIDAGFPAEDARDYMITGCVQPAPRATYGSTCAAHLVGPRTLELMLSQKGRSWRSFDEFFVDYKSLASGIVEQVRESLVAADRAHQELLPNPFVSAMMDGPLATGRDVKSGGVRNNVSGVSLMGIGTLVDSLMAIKRTVFEEKRYTLAEMKRMLATNFQSREADRAYLSNRVPKYGNDDPEVDGLAAELVDFFHAELTPHTTHRGGEPILGLHSEAGHVPFGFTTGATPDGRLATKPLSAGGGPSSGCEGGGYTAAFNSIGRIDFKKVLGGASVNMRFHPALFGSGSQTQKFEQMLRTYFFDLGGQHLHINVVSAETLRAAQRNPEQYRDLLVRIAGYSARFVDLTRATQDEIIERTEFGPATA